MPERLDLGEREISGSRRHPVVAVPPFCNEREKMGHPIRKTCLTTEDTEDTELNILSLVPLAYFFAPGLQRLFHQVHELVGYGAVDEAVIVAESEVDDGADCD